jgi:hypothetical protein
VEGILVVGDNMVREGEKKTVRENEVGVEEIVCPDKKEQ